MKNLLKKYRHSEEGFTLIELIIVIAILAIIAAIAIPNIIGAVDDSRKTTDIANAKIIASAMAQGKAQNDGYASVVLVKAKFTKDGSDTAGATTGSEATATEYIKKVYEALNSVVLKPKFDTSKHKDFYLSVNSNKIEVYVAGDDNTENLVMLYPTVDSSSDYGKK